jgi:hypothetical protein
MVVLERRQLCWQRGRRHAGDPGCPARQLGLPALAGSWIGGSWVKAGFVSETVELWVFAVLLPLLLGGALGALIGQRLAPHLPDRRLRQGFAALLVGSALLTAVEAVSHPSLSTQRTSTHPPLAIQS